MSCCTVVQSKRSVATGDSGPIMGTWDYKWPQGSRLRLAFQAAEGMNSATFNTLKDEIRKLAQTWEGTHAGIGFDPKFVPDFDPPAAKLSAKHPQHRSAIRKGDSWREYDILVSFEPLPLTIADTLTNTQRRVFLPTSELGSYARRIDYGTPTIYVGPMKVPAKDAEWVDYFQRNRLARTMVMHEFGHALGLGHEHQSPVFRQKRKIDKTSYDFKKARLLLIQRLGVPANELQEGDETNKFLEAHLGLSWPGNLRFSDWRGYEGEPLLDTIMAVPYHDCALKVCPCDPAQDCGTYQSELHQEPTRADKAFLGKLYPPA